MGQHMAMLGSSQRVLDKTFWARARAEPSACFERLAKLAVERPDVFAFDSGTQIAVLAEVSQTSVVRFAVFNGFRGIREMKIAFKEALKAHLKRTQ